MWFRRSHSQIHRLQRIMESKSSAGIQLKEHFNQQKMKRPERNVDKYKKKMGNGLPCNHIAFRVLGTGTYGSTKALLMQTEHTSYLFNCGEGILRQCADHGGNWMKLDHVFITYKTWSRLGGTLDLCMSLDEVQGKDMKGIFLHGPGYLDALVNTESRCFASDNANNAQKWPANTPFEDHTMSVENIILRDSRSPLDEERAAYAFCLKFKKHLRRVNREKLLALGLKMMGPWIQELQREQTSVEVEGRTIHANDILFPEEPPGVVTVLECPTEYHLESMLESCQSLLSDGRCPDAIIHLTPPEILNLDAYKRWMEQFPNTTKHLLVNEASEGITFSYAWMQQAHLNKLDKWMFPILYPKPILEDHQLCEKHDPSSNVWRCYPGSIYTFRPSPKRELNHREVPDMRLESADNYFADSATVKAALDKRMSQTVRDDTRDFPYVAFLGTSSAVSTRTRNVTGIYLQISDESSLLMDCGAGTQGQLLRLFGQEECDERLITLKSIFISHGHADHHSGLVSYLFARQAAFQRKERKLPQLYLLAPRKLSPWFQHLDTQFPGCMEGVRYIPLPWLTKDAFFSASPRQVMKKSQFLDPPALQPDERARLYESMELVNLEAVQVLHAYANNCFGLSVTHRDGWKIVYSGDTMPCENLVSAAQGCDLLIHEATFGDAFEKDAKLKTHSTISQAIDIAKRSRSKFTILTHFSTRYPRVPDPTDELLTSDIVGIAFDNLLVRFKDLPNTTLSSLWDVLATMYPDYVDGKQIRKRKIKALKDKGIPPEEIVRIMNEQTLREMERAKRIGLGAAVERPTLTNCDDGSESSRCVESAADRTTEESPCKIIKLDKCADKASGSLT